MNEIYVTGVVIPCGIPDHENDILNKQDIKKIFTKYLNRDTDTMHNYIRNQGVDVLANWISEKEQVIGDKIAPVGSWLATFRITNEEIIRSINEGLIKGLSLGSVQDKALTQKFWFINKSVNYRDLDDIEEAVPLFISFVDNPSNGFGLEIMDYNVYINKNAHEVDEMTDKKEVKEEKFSISTFQKMRDLFSIDKSTSVEEPVEHEEVKIEKETAVKAEPVQTEPADISNSELLEKIPDAVATGITSAFEKMGEAKKEEKAEPVKEEVKAEPVKEEEEEEREPETPKINKRATVKEEPVSQPNTSTDFYTKSGRDAFGCRIRK